VKMFDADKTRIIGLFRMLKNYDNMLIRFHPIPKRYGQTDRIAISISGVSVLTREKNVTNKICVKIAVIARLKN